MTRDRNVNELGGGATISAGNPESRDATLSPLVYLVEDDEELRSELVYGLNRLGIDIHGFSDAASLYRAFSAKPANIVVLDIGLEGEDGLSIASHLRTGPPIGIIIATATSGIDARLKSLEQGVDVYLVKPIPINDLAAVIKTIALRLQKNERNPKNNPVPEWSLEEGGWVLADANGNRLRLTTAEQKFLERLFRNRGDVVERSKLVEVIGGDIHDFSSTNLDTLVSRLRSRAQKVGMKLPLHAIRGVGFTFPE